MNNTKNYTEIITVSHWVNGSGWSYEDVYAGFDDKEISAENISMSYSANDFASQITDGYNDEELSEIIEKNENGEDDKYTYRIKDDEGNIIEEISIWMSDAAKYKLGTIEDVEVIK